VVAVELRAEDIELRRIRMNDGTVTVELDD
jgi:hypothetical protein